MAFLRRFFKKRVKLAPCYHCGLNDFEIETRPNKNRFTTVIRCKKCGAYTWASAETEKTSLQKAADRHNYEFYDFARSYGSH